MGPTLMQVVDVKGPARPDLRLHTAHRPGRAPAPAHSPAAGARGWGGLGVVDV